MPNWCNNGITIRHADPAMIDRVINHKSGLLNEFLPCPAELHEYEAPQRDPVLAEQLREKYGASDWYNWQVQNWGTKWDFDFDSIEREDANTVRASFESAWAPPTNAYEKLIEMGFYIKAYYYEPGMGFCGVWEGDMENGFDDDYCEYSGETSETVREAIGEELDDYFGISESMAEWEEENADE